jgi:hypothetical protein
MRWAARWLALALLAGALAACGGGTPPEGGAELRKSATAAGADAQLTGTYWNAAEPGTGFFFEAQGGFAVATFYVFEASGRSVWYSAYGALQATAGGHAFTGVLQRFSGGQPPNSSTPRTPVGTTAGELSIRFEGNGAARVQLPGRAFDAMKFVLSAVQLPMVPLADQSAVQLETGIYWNPAESGRGFTIEMVNGHASIGVFHYDASGQPMWNLVTAALDKDGGASGDLAVFRGGQTLAGPHVAPVRDADAGKLRIKTVTPCSAQLAFPGMAPIEVQRFSFNAAVGACRSGNLETLPRAGGTGLTAPVPTPIAEAGITWQKYMLPVTAMFHQAVPTAPVTGGLEGRKAVYTLAAGSLPHGMHIDPDTGVIAGVPTQNGTFRGKVALQVPGYTGELLADFEMTTVAILPRVRSSGTPNPHHVVTFAAGQPVQPGSAFYLSDGFAGIAQLASGVTTTYRLDFTSAMPPGLTLDPQTGSLSGTPLITGTHTTKVHMDIRYGDVFVTYALSVLFNFR